MTAISRRNNRLFRPIRQTIAATALLSSILTACSFSTPLAPSNKAPEGANAMDQTQAAQFTDIPIPGGARMDLDRSLVLGPRENWIGRLVFTSSASPNDVFEFYARELPRFGWTAITAVRASTSVLSHSRDERVATVQIGRTTLGGSEVLVTISPRNNGTVGAGIGNGYGGQYAAPSSAPVARQPLR